MTKKAAKHKRPLITPEAVIVDQDSETKTHVVANLPHIGKTIHKTIPVKKVGWTKNAVSWRERKAESEDE